MTAENVVGVVVTGRREKPGWKRVTVQRHRCPHRYSRTTSQFLTKRSNCMPTAMARLAMRSQAALLRLQPEAIARAGAAGAAPIGAIAVIAIHNAISLANLHLKCQPMPPIARFPVNSQWLRPPANTEIPQFGANAAVVRNATTEAVVQSVTTAALVQSASGQPSLQLSRQPQPTHLLWHPAKHWLRGCRTAHRLHSRRTAQRLQLPARASPRPSELRCHWYSHTFCLWTNWSALLELQSWSG